MPPQIGEKMIVGEVVTNGTDVLTDNRGHRYYLPEGTRIRLKSGPQKSMSSTDSGETEGSFAVGSILHGSAPKNASYLYGIGIGGGEALPYQVLQQDRYAHVAKVGEILCAARFVPGEAAGVETDTPVLLMMRQEGAELHLAVCNPDLGQYSHDASQFDEHGVQREVSIYSRSWIKNPVASKQAHIRLPGQDVDKDGKLPLAQEDGKTCLTLNLKGGSVVTMTLTQGQ